MPRVSSPQCPSIRRVDASPIVFSRIQEVGVTTCDRNPRTRSNTIFKWRVRVFRFACCDGASCSARLLRHFGGRALSLEAPRRLRARIPVNLTPPPATASRRRARQRATPSTGALDLPPTDSRGRDSVPGYRAWRRRDTTPGRRRQPQRPGPSGRHRSRCH